MNTPLKIKAYQTNWETKLITLVVLSFLAKT